MDNLTDPAVVCSAQNVIYRIPAKTMIYLNTCLEIQKCRLLLSLWPASSDLFGHNMPPKYHNIIRRDLANGKWVATNPLVLL